MSYDLAFWEGPAPRSHAEAEAVFDQLADEFDERGTETAGPTPALEQLLENLTRRWPDGVEDTPWADPPSEESASGPFLYLTLELDVSETDIDYMAATAKELGLVCFDPQRGMLLTSSPIAALSRDRQDGAAVATNGEPSEESHSAIRSPDDAERMSHWYELLVYDNESDALPVDLARERFTDGDWRVFPRSHRLRKEIRALEAQRPEVVNWTCYEADSGFPFASLIGYQFPDDHDSERASIRTHFESRGFTVVEFECES